MSWTMVSDANTLQLELRPILGVKLPNQVSFAMTSTACCLVAAFCLFVWILHLKGGYLIEII